MMIFKVAMETSGGSVAMTTPLRQQLTGDRIVENGLAVADGSGQCHGRC